MAFVPRALLTDAAEEGIWAVAWSQTGHILAGGCDETLRSFKISGNEKVDIVRQLDMCGHHLGVTSVAVCPEAALAASSALDSRIRLWNLESGKEALSFDAGPLEAWTVALAPKGSLIASGSRAGNVNIWNASSGQKLAAVTTGSDTFVMSVAYSPDGLHVACGTAEGAIYILDVNSQRMIHRLDGHSAHVRALSFSSDGALLISGSDDAHANIHEVSSMQQVGSLAGHSSWVLGVAASPDHGTLATCSADCSVRIWDIGTRQALQTVSDAHTEQVRSPPSSMTTHACQVALPWSWPA